MSKVYVVKCKSCIDDDFGHSNLTGIVSICTTAELALEHIAKAVDLYRKELECGGIECAVNGHPDRWLQSITYKDGAATIEHTYCCEEFETDVFYSDETYGTEEGV